MFLFNLRAYQLELSPTCNGEFFSNMISVNKNRNLLPVTASLRSSVQLCSIFLEINHFCLLFFNLLFLKLLDIIWVIKNKDQILLR